MTDYAQAIRWEILPYINGEGLDIGCSDARPHDWMVGIDRNAGRTQKGPNQIRDARKLAGYFADESQDFIFSSFLLQELGDWPEVLAGWWRLLKPNGYLILYLPIIEEAEGVPACNAKKLVDAMLPLRPWQPVELTTNGNTFLHVYRKCDGVYVPPPDPEKVCAVIKLGAHGDALWASSVFPHLKEQGYYTLLYCQETTEEVLRHDPYIDRIIRFESRVPMGELGELFQWLEKKYKHTRILIECVEGTLLPSPSKIQYHFPQVLRHKLMNFSYLEVHHMQARVPYEPRQKFYPNEEEKLWANQVRSGLSPYVVALVPNGSSCTKFWPYAGELAKYLLRRPDVTVAVLGDLRGTTLEEHPRLLKVGLDWNIRKAMTFCQLANVVVGQETGLLNCVAFEPEVKKIVLLTHSSVENLTRDWQNTVSLHGECDDYPCHRLQYTWEFCQQDKWTEAAKCQASISARTVLDHVLASLPEMEKAA